jgi:hypothetical protein
MKKRIEFKTDMLLAIRDKRKTETRRLVKHEAAELLRQGYSKEEVASRHRGLSPYGYEGNEIGIIEPYRVQQHGANISGKLVHVRGVYTTDYTKFRKDLTEKESAAFLKWKRKYDAKPPMYMFGSLIRTHIKLVAEPTIEFLQDITNEAAKAEGMTPVPGDDKDAYRKAFFIRFNAIYNDDTFHLKNPAVWVYKFSLL